MKTGHSLDLSIKFPPLKLFNLATKITHFLSKIKALDSLTLAVVVRSAVLKSCTG